MRKYQRFVVAALIVLLSFVLSFSTSAHPGKTDSSGGHTDHSTGEYHYHHGYDAHQHNGGECPFDFDDRTGQNSGTASGRATDTNKTNRDSVNRLSPVVAKTEEEVTQVPPWVYWVIGILSFTTLCVFFALRSARHENEQLRVDLRSKQDIEKENASMKKLLGEKDFDIRALQAKAKHQAKTIQGLMSKNSDLLAIVEQVGIDTSRENFVQRFGECGASEIEIPSDIYFINGLVPISGMITEDRPFGDLTVYVAQGGQRYHSYRGCGSGYLRAIHVYDVLGKKSPCRICARPFPARPPEWYTKVKAITDRI